MKRIIFIILVFNLIFVCCAYAARDNATNIVTDDRTGLMWQDDTDASSYTANFSDAINYCENITLGGYTDWRMPNMEELESIIARRRYKLAIKSDFINAADGKYWSSTYYSIPLVYVINSRYGELNCELRGENDHVRCVRGGKTIK